MRLDCLVGSSEEARGPLDALGMSNLMVLDDLREV